MELLKLPDSRPEATQESDQFEDVYAWASKARDQLRNTIADAWYEDEERKRLKKTPFFYPVEDKKQKWVDHAIDPGIKGKERAEEKRVNDYGGHANMLKDLARITLVCESCGRMLAIVKELKEAGFEVVILKNKYQSPTVRRRKRA